MPEPSTYTWWTISATVSAALTLVTWVFFYFETPDAPLDTISTTVVFGGWFVVVLLARFGWRRIVPAKR